jgi:hypothetical protein
MKTRTYFANTLLCCCLLLMIARQLPAQPFIHPGLLHTEADFARMRDKVNASAQPWKGSWDILVANGRSQLSWNARPVDTVRRGGDRQNYGQLMNDIAAAYQTALRWKITGDVAYANKSIEIMNAWSSTLQFVTGNADRFLAAGIYGYQFANAAEIMRTYSGWAAADFDRFRNMLLTKFYPLSNNFLVNHNDACITNYWANWDLCNMTFILSLGVLCDRRDLYNRAIDYFKNGAGNGSITHAVWYLHSSTLGQWQESGRDQGHCTLGIGLMGAFCEMAWNQGDDMYGYDSNRFMKGAEYVAKYNIGDSVPYVTYNWGTGQNCAASSQTVISSNSRGNIRPVWEMVYNHYANRMGLSVPAMAAYATIHRPEGGGGNYGTASGGFDQLGYGSLTFTRDPLPAGGPANGTYMIFARHSGKAMDVINNAAANGSNVRQWTANDCACQRWTLTNTGSGQYSIVGVGSGKNLDVNGVSTADGANIQIWQSTNATNQRFTFTSTGGGFYRITPVHSGKAVDVNAAGMNDGANIQQWTYNSAKNQQWQLIPVTSTSSARTAMPLTKEINDEREELSIYPNPPVNNVTVTLPAALTKSPAVITLSDINGRVLYRGQSADRKHVIDMGSFVPGVYFITVSNGTEKITRKIIK